MPSIYNAKIGFCGTEPELKVKGKYKKFNIEFDDGVFRTGSWKCYLDDKEFTEVTYKTDGYEPNEVGIRFDGGKEYIDSILTIKYITDTGSETPLDVRIVSL